MNIEDNLKEYLEIPENEEKFERLIDSLSHTFPEIDLNRLYFNLDENENVRCILSGDGDIRKITALLVHYFPHKLP